MIKFVGRKRVSLEVNLPKRLDSFKSVGPEKNPCARSVIPSASLSVQFNGLGPDLGLDFNSLGHTTNTHFAGSPIPTIPPGLVTGNSIGETIGENYLDTSFQSEERLTPNKEDPGDNSPLRRRESGDDLTASVVIETEMEATSEGNLGREKGNSRKRHKGKRATGRISGMTRKEMRQREFQIWKKFIDAIVVAEKEKRMWKRKQLGMGVEGKEK